MLSSNDFGRALTKKDILREVSQVDIFRFYLNIEPTPRQLIKSPLRQDKNPTCSFYSNRGVLYFKDYATGEHLDCFGIVRKIFGFSSFYHILNKINKDMILIKKSKSDVKIEKLIEEFEKEEVHTVKISIEVRDWRDYDLEWWNSFGISQKTLNLFNVYPVRRAFVNGKQIYFENKKSPCYAYHFKNTDTIKLYQPFSKKYKWISNCPHEELQGDVFLQDNLNKDLIITKSLKDVMTLHEAGFNAVAVQSETSQFYPNLLEVIESIKKNGFDVYLLYDNDEPGKKAAKQKVEEYNLTQIQIPEESECKDPSDFVQKYGLMELQKNIDRCLNFQ